MKEHWVLSRSEKMSENDVKQIDFNEDTLNILYDTAVAIRKENHNNPDNKTIFSSLNKQKATIDAAMHIAYILTQLKDRVLVVNLDGQSVAYVEEYIHSKAKPNLFTTLKTSMFLSEAINPTECEKLDIIHVEDLPEEDLKKKFNEYNVLSKLSPLKNYYDNIFIIGPEVSNIDSYGTYLELADSALTVISAKNNNRKDLKHYLQKINLFNVKSFGILRKAD